MRELKKFWSIIDPKQKRKTIFIFCLIIFTMLVETLSIGSVFPAITLFTNYKSSGLSYLDSFFQNFTNVNQLTLLIYVAIFMILVFFFKLVFLIFSNYQIQKYVTSLNASISTKLFSNYMKSSYVFFTKYNSSFMAQNILYETNLFSSSIMQVINFITEIFILLGIVILLIFLETSGALLSSIIFIIFGAFLFKITKKKLINLGKLRQELAEKKLRFIQQGIGGIKEIKIFNKETMFINFFSDANIKSSIVAKNSNFIMSLPKIFIEFFAVVIVSLFLFFVFSKSNNFSITLPILGVFIISAFRAIPSINRVLASLQKLKLLKHAIDTVYNEINKKEFDIKFINLKNKNTQIIKYQKDIKIKNISFGYTEREKVLKDINFTINKNDFIGIQGQSGSGKSTLINILLGLILPDSGSIIIDNKYNIFDNISSWQNNIGFVPQEVFLTNDSIYNNVAFEENCNNELFTDCLKKARIYNFVYSLKNGPNTILGERGLNISGGQKQRLGIARALYSKPEILVLDESFSALDKENEDEILNEINSLSKICTIILVSHKESSLKYCNKILKL